MRCKSRADACLKKTRTISWILSQLGIVRWISSLVLRGLSDTQYHRVQKDDEMGWGKNDATVGYNSLRSVRAMLPSVTLPRNSDVSDVH